MPGRDAFIEILRKHGLMVHLRRRKRYKTTDSTHHYRKYPNLIKEIIPMRPNEIWVADITYVETEEGVCYLSLITDAYSHKIVGWALGPTLETMYPLQALQMALATIDENTAGRLIHHSDRGCQYCSDAYVSELKRHGIGISMTQSGDPLENAVAERANGILKTEWPYKMSIATREECRSELERIIGFYNTERPHVSIGMQTPEVAYTQSGTQRRCWKNRRFKIEVRQDRHHRLCHWISVQHVHQTHRKIGQTAIVYKPRPPGTATETCTGHVGVADSTLEDRGRAR